MKISVVIPAYNASATIDETIRSVLVQTCPADEILVMDDGSTDDTFARLSAFGPQIKAFRQSNQGLSFTRNFLCRQAMGDVIAFLDADDVWHPDYLKAQQAMLSAHPNAAASLTGCLDSNHFEKNSWGSLDSDSVPVMESMSAVQFFKCYNRSTPQFPPSTWCVSKKVLDGMGDEPFPVRLEGIGRLTGAEDFWFMNVLLLFGKPVIYNPSPLVMYRLSPGSLSTDRVKMTELAVRVGEILVRRYQMEASPEFLRFMREVLSATRRKYARYLMGTSRCSEARAQVWLAIRNARNLVSIGKSLFLLAFCCLPAGLQPKWPQFRKHHYQVLSASAKISVVIPAYNASATIGEAIASVLAQTRPADEILAMDDGSTDDTFARLSAFGSRIKVFQQPNQGAATARNFLCHQAGGDFVAFLDADDLWHPDYLKTQLETFSQHPEAAASFTSYLNSLQFEKQSWGLPPSGAGPEREVLGNVQFLKRYNSLAHRFLPSACCVSKTILNQMGNEPFPVQFKFAEDYWFMNVIALLGRSVIYSSLPLVMYRLSPGSLSVDRLRSMDNTIRSCEILSRRFRVEANSELLRTWCEVFASLRRKFAKYLMGAGRPSEARGQIKLAMLETPSLTSFGKSVFLLLFCCMPASLQPRWPRQFHNHYYQMAAQPSKPRTDVPQKNL